jgi:hypothetical protein
MGVDRFESDITKGKIILHSSPNRKHILKHYAAGSVAQTKEYLFYTEDFYDSTTNDTVPMSYISRPPNPNDTVPMSYIIMCRAMNTDILMHSGVQNRGKYKLFGLLFWPFTASTSMKLEFSTRMKILDSLWVVVQSSANFVTICRPILCVKHDWTWNNLFSAYKTHDTRKSKKMNVKPCRQQGNAVCTHH